MPTFRTVQSIAHSLPGVTESTLHGKPSLKVNGKLLCCVPVHKSAEPDSAVVRVDPAKRDQLLRAFPDKYYVTDHYVPYAMILVRLSRIEERELEELLRAAVTPVKGAAVKSRRPRAPK
jgi:hypothetical protein